MSADKKRFKLNIAGKNYVVIGDSTSEHMLAVAQLADEQYKEIRQTLPTVTREDAAILLAINAISDQLKKQKELDEFKRRKHSDKNSR